MFRLLGVERKWLTCLCVAESTAASTDIAANHKGGCSPTPALPHVGTSPTAADGMQAMGLYDAFRLGVALIGAYADFQPLGLSGSLFWFHTISLSLQFTVEEVGQAGVEVQTSITSVNAMVAIGVKLHLERFIELHQMLSIFGTLLEVDVVVGHAVYQ